MKKMNKTIAQHILFTGAGFTKNFAGFLATEMWTKIFNHSEVQNYPYLRELLLDDFDYESIYYKVLSGNYSADEKEAIQNAIFEAYQKLDAIACEYTPITETSKASIHAGAKQLIDQFIRDINQINCYIQPARATQEEKTSVGVLKFRHFLGLLFKRFSIVFSLAGLIIAKSVFFGKKRRIRPMAYSTEPFSQLW